MRRREARSVCTIKLSWDERERETRNGAFLRDAQEIIKAFKTKLDELQLILQKLLPTSSSETERKLKEKHKETDRGTSPIK
jgi:hypothetical protein